MQKLNLVALAYERDAVLNALQRTGATEIKQQAEVDSTVPLVSDCENLKETLNYTENALAILSAEIEEYNSDRKIKSDELKDGFEVSYSEFMGASSLKAQIDGVVKCIYALSAERKSLLSDLSRAQRDLQVARIYKGLEQPFTHFTDTPHVRAKLGTVPKNEIDALKKAVEENELCGLGILGGDGESSLVLFVCHKASDGEGILQSFGFAACPYREGTGAGIYAECASRIDGISARLKEIKNELLNAKEFVKPLKIYCDYLGFEIEKQEAAEKFRATDGTFLLEAYVPKEAEESVKTALDGVSTAIYYEFTEPAEDEIPPTLYRNNKVVENFETITNMYSPVNSKEFDPNGIMSFFYSLFLGFIMGDIGYGLLMLIGGGAIYWVKRKDDGGLKRMSGVFAIGGIFAILWGVAFGSLFGIPIFESVMPNAKDDTWTVMGISVPAVLLISMELGIVHLMAGYVCKAIQHMRRGHFWDGIFEGLVWAVFSIGVGIAIAGFIEQANMPQLTYIGGGIAGVSLLIAMLTAGRHEKFFGKITKGFGAAYGIINYVSDVLSYARLYGLMLSGAVIAQIVAEYTVIGNGSTVGFIVSGNPLLIVLGVLIFVVGHLFNLAIGLLGAYIHDARLQYVEFYGRFYEGEGELFTPLGSTHNYIKVK